jgi:anti-sigma28 factor (negative regulator of flagellin synthesis)
MRVEGFDSSPVRSAPASQPVEKTAGAGAAQVVNEKDDVGLSRLSQVLTQNSDQTARIEQLRLEVEAGSYQAPASEVSRKIVDFHLEE